jgi:hypothetical protein
LRKEINQEFTVKLSKAYCNEVAFSAVESCSYNNDSCERLDRETDWKIVSNKSSKVVINSKSQSSAQIKSNVWNNQSVGSIGSNRVPFPPPGLFSSQDIENHNNFSSNNYDKVLDISDECFNLPNNEEEHFNPYTSSRGHHLIILTG